MDFDYEKEELLSCREDSIKKILAKYKLKPISREADIENILDYQDRIRRSNLVMCPVDIHSLISKYLSLTDIFLFTQVNKKLRGLRKSTEYTNYISNKFLTNQKERKPKDLFSEIPEIVSKLLYSYLKGYEIYYFGNSKRCNINMIAHTEYNDMFYRGLYSHMHQSALRSDMVYNFDSFIELRDICLALDVQTMKEDSTKVRGWSSFYNQLYYYVALFSARKKDNKVLRYLLNGGHVDKNRGPFLTQLIKSKNIEILDEMNLDDEDLQYHVYTILRDKNYEMLDYLLEKDITISEMDIDYSYLEMLEYLHDKDVINLSSNKSLLSILDLLESDSKRSDINNLFFTILRKYHKIKTDNWENKKLLKYFDEMNKTTKMKIIVFYLKRDLVTGFRYLLSENPTAVDKKKFLNISVDHWSINCLKYLIDEHDIDLEQRKKNIQFCNEDLITYDSVKFMLNKKVIKKGETNNLMFLVNKLVADKKGGLDSVKYIIEHGSFNDKDISKIMHETAINENKDVFLYLFSEYRCLPIDWDCYTFCISLKDPKVNKAILEKTKYTPGNRKKYSRLDHEDLEILVKFRHKNSNDKKSTIEKFISSIEENSDLYNYLKKEHHL